MAKNPAILPSWVQTAGAIKDNSAPIRAMCSVCKGWRDVDIDRTIAAKGRDYSLIGRRMRCNFTPDCKGWIKFHYLCGVYRPLWEEKHIDGWMERDRLRGL